MNLTLDGLFNKNETYDYGDYEYPGEEEIKGDDTVWIPLLYSIFVIVGLLGNGLLLAVLGQKSRSWTVSDSFILQLGVVDILLLVTLPFYAAHANKGCEWCTPTFFKICVAVFKINLYVGIFLLVCACLDLYLYSIYADRASCHRASFAFFGWLAAWLVSIVLTVLDSLYLKPVIASLPGKALSALSPPDSGMDLQLISRVLHLGVGVLLPALVLVVCSSNIMIRCRANNRQKKQPVVLLLSLVTVFLVCWIPYNITLFIDAIYYMSKNHLRSFPLSSLTTAVKVTSAVGCVSACLRPFLYFLLCRNFRTGIFSLLKCNREDFRGSMWELGMDGNATHDLCQSEDEMKQMTSTEKQVEPV
ncbi:PREDICTED: C-X-C chemokine receptor type 4-B-like [Cyprinodon variegatus]|uniref:G-protein coupled receptors family 1 profile domain-containing protein n=1 Tax=Cyprinodon variegatus TaxID=28743 RepID=A0A3Q2CLG8_CYPVA|nr:PREDICTED: C-X-C chemokine receptor type 4-B-like [Cyprinodon variegatus]XP_015254105.1 PREDICTED: C-X-C chemokine receptor type 4-B-like [Cyprinodon variegatus]